MILLKTNGVLTILLGDPSNEPTLHHTSCIINHDALHDPSKRKAAVTQSRRANLKVLESPHDQDNDRNSNTKDF